MTIFAVAVNCCCYCSVVWIVVDKAIANSNNNHDCLSLSTSSISVIKSIIYMTRVSVRLLPSLCVMYILILPENLNHSYDHSSLTMHSYSATKAFAIHALCMWVNHCLSVSFCLCVLVLVFFCSHSFNGPAYDIPVLVAKWWNSKQTQKHEGDVYERIWKEVQYI